MGSALAFLVACSRAPSSSLYPLRMKAQWPAIFVLSLASALRAQSVNLHHVDMTVRAEQKLSGLRKFEPVRQSALRRLMATDPDVKIADANTGPYDDPIVFTVASLRLGSPSVVAVKADGDQLHACCWIVDLSGRPRILGNLGGGHTWGEWVQPPVHHGLHDFAEAHELSADGFVLSYLRFDGRRYRIIAHDEVKRCDTSDQTIHCFSDGFRLREDEQASFTPVRPQ